MFHPTRGFTPGADPFRTGTGLVRASREKKAVGAFSCATLTAPSGNQFAFSERFSGPYPSRVRRLGELGAAYLGAFGAPLGA